MKNSEENDDADNLAKNPNEEDKMEDNKDDQEKDEQSIRDYIRELTERFQEKRKKRYENDPTNIEYPDEDLFVRLDTSIKKNTAFVKKIRNMNETNKDLIMKDLENLNLTRFISELATALVETKIKATEINLFIQICSFLHHRYPEFAVHLFDAWNKNLPKKPTDQFNASKMRIDIKIFTELILSGIFSTKDSLPALGNLLTILTNSDKESHKNLNILIVFCRSYGVEFAGIYPRRQRLLAEKFQQNLPVCDFLSIERQKGVRTLLKDYYQSLIQHISKDRKYLFHLKNDMKRNLETRGEVSETLQERWKTKSTEFEKLHQSTIIFADLIDEQMPDIDIETLENDTILMKNENVTAVLFDLNRFKENNPTIWDDEETRIFYEKLPDLKSLVPAMLYKDSLKDDTTTATAASNNLTETGKEISETDIADLTNDDDDLILTGDDTTIPDPKDVPLLNENDDLDVLDDNKTTTTTTMNGRSRLVKFNFNATKDQLDTFFSSLPNCVNCDLIDKAALHFATTFNTKNNRKKLVDVLIRVPRTRLDLLPFYGRFVAQLTPIMPSVSNELCVGLKNQFRYNFYKKDQVYIESKVKIIRFISELVKFNLFSKTEALKILKTLLSDFHHHHIEMTCNLFEVCGRYLYRCPESHHMTNLLLQQMMRLKNHMYVNTRYETMIQNAYYSVTSEDKSSSRIIPAKPIMHQYIEHLIYTELTRKNVSNVLKKLRRLNWNDKDINTFAIKTLSSAWNIKYDNIPALASLLSNLSQNRSQTVLMVMDTILENIRIGMQMNSLEYNQRRIATIKYFAECFNYNLFDSTLLFNIMYSLLLYGVDYNDLSKSTMDSPFNLIRFRLVAQILHICGHFLLSPVAKKKLDFFLLFFQRYYWLKKSYINSLPIETIDQMSLFYLDAIFADVLQFLRLKFKKAESYEDSCKQLEQSLEDLAKNLKNVLPNLKNVSIKNVLTNQATTTINNNNKDGGQLEPIKEDSENEIIDDNNNNDGDKLQQLPKKHENNNNSNNKEDNFNPFIIINNNNNNQNDCDNNNNSGGGGNIVTAAADYNSDYDQEDNDEGEEEDNHSSIGAFNNDNNNGGVGCSSSQPIIEQQSAEQKDNYNDPINNADIDPDDDSDDDDDLDSNEEDIDEDEYDDDDIDDEDVDVDEEDDDDDIGDDEDSDENQNQNNKSNKDGGGLRIQPCEEDDKFQLDFERLMMENLQSRSQEVTQRINVEINHQQQQQHRNRQQSSKESEETKFNFRVMTKNQKSNKPILRSIEVPVDSDLVQNFLEREREKKREKEQVKKLILGFNERREMEDHQNPSNSSSSSISSVNSNNIKSMAAGDHHHYQQQNRSPGGGGGGYFHHYRGGSGGGGNYRKRFQ
ncbi:Regulator of nonsense transcripts upf2 [Dermatophagoides pteronyssinus]|uniref:Regulator of nonsense transcripts upf2 n=1 Tax=Dermatophagoides pteronyssinus TaxID=6956 RepID=A0ABQ8IT07_DERPT|nr:Regulator of nonsense transcripts upf2 [Dermatophagoides pteronyssinus]